MSNEKLNLHSALTLALIVATCWEEDDRREPGKKNHRAWKGFLYSIMQELEERGLILARSYGSSNVKSLQITDAGMKIGADLLQQLRLGFIAWMAKGN